MATVYQADITDLVKPHLEEAKQKGKAEGFAEGEHKNKLETARKMIEKNFSHEEISQITGLSQEEIKSL